MLSLAILTFIIEKKIKIALNQVFVPKLAFNAKTKSHKIALKGWGLGFKV